MQAKNIHEEILHESADRKTVIKKVRTHEGAVSVVKEIIGMDRFTKLFFEREVGALKALNHCDNIVKMFNCEVIQIDSENNSIGRIHLEYIYGKNLNEIDSSIIEFKDKYNIILDIVNGIESAHSKGIIHRDIKPANIMIINHCSAKIIDFGISKIKGMISNDTVGTVNNYASNKYTAPEVRYHTSNSSFKSDLYSLGATLYYFLTGEEPPLPEKISEAFNRKSGINAKLKPLIAKCICFDADDRYESITDFKREYLSIFNELLENSNYTISIPSDIYDHAKYKKFIPSSVKFDEFIEDYLHEWFKNPYAIIDTPLNGAKRISMNHDVVLFGGKYKLLCSFNDYDEYLIAVELSKVDAKVKNEFTRTYMKIEGRMHFYNSSKLKIDEIENQTLEVINELIDHRIEYESDESKQSKFDKFFGSWNKYLETDRNMIKSNSTKIQYKSCEYKSDGTIELVLHEDVAIDELNFDPETILAYDPEMNGNYRKNNGYIKVGAYYEIKSSRNSVVMILNKMKESSRRIPLNGGVLVIDYKTSVNVIDKQLNALFRLKKNECECNENLRDMILGFEKPSSIKGFEDITYHDNRLDLNQKSAVKIALCTSSVCVIQGPPGTGKTSVIREIINQILDIQNRIPGSSKYRILIVSQSHTAVDHVLDGLDDIGGCSKVIRIGSDNKVIERIYQKFGVDAAHNNWMENVKSKTLGKIKELSNAYNIEFEAIERYSELKSQAHDKEYSDDEKHELDKFEETYFSKKEVTRIVNTIMIQFDWIRRLRLAKDSEMRLIENATIVAGTCTGFNSNPIVKNMKFDYVIIDEAAKAGIPELLIPLLMGSRLILVGDHNQLPPTINDKVVKSCDGVSKEELESGLFEHLYDSFPTANRIKLSTQYRMHETIGDMISKIFYNGEIDTGVEASKRVHNLERFRDKQIVWLSTSNMSYKDRKEYPLTGKTYKNREEVKEIISILQEINKEIVDNRYEVAVITGYSGQRDAIKDEINRMNFDNDKIEVNTVDAYQGRDKDIVIFSTVRSNNNKEIGFQKSKKRINVAFSRAQKLIVIVGDHKHFLNSTHDLNKFPDIINYIENTDGCSIELMGVHDEKKKRK